MDSSQFDFSGYVPLKPGNHLSSDRPTPATDLQPGRSSNMRCPLPILGQSPDAQRSFYLKGNVPQTRFLTPQALDVNGGTTTTTTGVVVASSASSGSTTTIVAKSTSITTAVIAPNQQFTGVIPFSRSFQLLTLSVNSAARVRIYGTSSSQSGDLGRGLDIPPAAGTAQNIICDVVLDTLPLSWSFQDRVGANADAPQTTTLYITVTNLDTNSDAITVTFQYVPLQT